MCVHVKLIDFKCAKQQVVSALVSFADFIFKRAMNNNEFRKQLRRKIKILLLCSKTILQTVSGLSCVKWCLNTRQKVYSQSCNILNVPSR